jgi:hypothetical protein
MSVDILEWMHAKGLPDLVCPASTSAGKVRNVLPPATELMTPATNAVAINARMVDIGRVELRRLD